MDHARRLGAVAPPAVTGTEPTPVPSAPRTRLALVALLLACHTPVDPAGPDTDAADTDVPDTDLVDTDVSVAPDTDLPPDGPPSGDPADCVPTPAPPCSTPVHRPLVTTSDTNHDGAIDWRETRAYDADGHEVLYERDANDDGVVDDRHTQTWADGHLVGADLDEDGNGTIEWRYAYTYDSSGRQSLFTMDRAADGEIDSTTTDVYDSAGNRASAHRVDTVSSDTTALDWLDTYEYDAASHLLHHHRAIDNGADGVIDSYDDEVYDSRGQPLSTKSETQWGPGMRDGRTTTWTYADGRLVRKADELYWHHGTGSPPSQRTAWTYTYDTFGWLDTTREDSGANGSVEVITTTRWDSCGRPTLERARATDTHEVAFERTYTYDGLGRLIVDAQFHGPSEDFASDASTVTNTWDADGNLVTQVTTRERSPGSPVSSRVARTFGACGSWISEEHDDGDDGTVDWRTTYAE